MTENVDPNALDGDPHAPGTPAAAVQQHPPVWDSHPAHHRWEYIPELGGWIHDNDPDSLCTEVAAIPYPPVYGYPAPHPRCRLGECPCTQRE